MFRLTDGRLTLENLEIELPPPQAGQTAQSLVYFSGDGQCIFKKCLLTFTEKLEANPRDPFLPLLADLSKQNLARVAFSFARGHSLTMVTKLLRRAYVIMSMVCSRYARFLVTPLIFWTTLAIPLRSERQQYEGKRIVDIQFSPLEQPVAASDLAQALTVLSSARQHAEVS